MNTKNLAENFEEDENEVPRRHAGKRRETDLPDNQHDEDRMQPEELIIELPDVSDIPGQEHIHVPQFKEMQDVTIASDDEEGVGLFGDEDEALLADDINDKLSPKQEMLWGKLNNAINDDTQLEENNAEALDDEEKLNEED